MGVGRQDGIPQVSGSLQGLRIAFVAGREPSYVRNAMLLRALRIAGAEVTVCASRLPSYPLRFLEAAIKFGSAENADMVVVGFLGHPLVSIIPRFASCPLVFDAFISVGDTLTEDRGWIRPESLAARLAYRLDQAACDGANLVLLDTAAHAEFFREKFDIDPSRIAHVYVGADPEVFRPSEGRPNGRRFRVFFYTTFRRLHGAETVLQAASLLRRSDNIEFVVGGNGPLRRQTLARFHREDLSRVSFLPWIPFPELPGWIRESDLCLAGHFGNSGKARRVIPGKVFQFLACSRAVVMSDGPGNREILANGENAFMVPHSDPESLANCIEAAAADRESVARLALAGYRTYARIASPQAIAARLTELFADLP